MPRWLLPYCKGLNVRDKEDTKNVKALTLNTMGKGGRGIGTIRSTNHFLNEIWESGSTRNSELVTICDFQADNPEAKDFKKWIMADGLYDKFNKGRQVRRFYPLIMKFSQVGILEEDNYQKNADDTYKLTALGEHGVVYAWGSLSANTSMKDEYMYRLAGTYPLRAEVCLANNEPDKAMADLNEFRDCARIRQLTSSSEVTFDFTLDEQMRELYFEDFRVPTLCRLGKMMERSRKYNSFGANAGDHRNLLPIPYSEIEESIFNKTEQNPDYEKSQEFKGSSESILVLHKKQVDIYLFYKYQLEECIIANTVMRRLLPLCHLVMAGVIGIFAQGEN